MKRKEPWVFRMILFLGAVFLGTEVSRLYYQHLNTRLVEEGSYLSRQGFDLLEPVAFNIDHIFTSYFPLVTFAAVIMLLLAYSKFHNTAKVLFVLIATILSLAITMLLSKEHRELSSSWYFTGQLGICISYGLCHYFHYRKTLRLQQYGDIVSGITVL